MERSIAILVRKLKVFIGTFLCQKLVAALGHCSNDSGMCSEVNQEPQNVDMITYGSVETVVRVCNGKICCLANGGRQFATSTSTIQDRGQVIWWFGRSRS
jgi:hypothetical protein